MAETLSTHLRALIALDRVVHEPVRLAVLALLSVTDSCDFVYLLRQLGITQGNLSSHLSRLEATGYVEVTKEFAGKRPRTYCRLSAAGRSALAAYLEALGSSLSRI